MFERLWVELEPSSHADWTSHINENVLRLQQESVWGY